MRSGSLPASRRSQLFGRAELLSSIQTWLATGGGVVLTGPDGIGKSAILGEVGAAASPGTRVLRLAPAEAERSMPYSGLVDLFTQFPSGVLVELPPGPRAAVEAVLLGPVVPPAARDRPGFELACGRALRDALERIARRQPVLLLLDDTQWLDAASATAIGYAVRRVGGSPVRTVAAVRPAEPDAVERATGMSPAPVLELAVPPLDAADLAALLEAHRFSGRAASRLHAESGGNPYLALALGGAFGSGPETAWRSLPLPATVRARLRRRLDALGPEVTETLLFAALAARPTVARLRLAGRAEAERHVRLAGSVGLVELDGPVVRLTPVGVRTVLVDDAGAARRATIHAALAEAATDRADRVRHHALASEGPVPGLTRSLITAAETALRRGAHGLGAELYLLAAERTPTAEHQQRQAWLVTAAEAGAVAGLPDLAGRAAEAVLAGESATAYRVRARTVLIDLADGAIAEMDHAFAAALAEAGSSAALLAPLRLRLARRALGAGAAARASAEADAAIRYARVAGDAATEAMALVVRAQVQRVRAQPGHVQTLARALARSAPEASGRLHQTPRFLTACFAFADDRIDAARDILLTLLALTDRGGGDEHIEVLRGLAEVSARAGRCREALHYAQRAMRLCEQARRSPGPCWYSLAVAELAGGRLPRALAYAERGTRASEEERDSVHLGRNLHVLGQARLRTGQNRAGVEALRRLRDLEAAQGVADPSLLRWHGDLASGLAALGAYDEAADTVADGRRAALRLGHPAGVTARLDRAAALVLAERGDLESAVDLAASSAECFATLGQPIEQGHALLVQGGAERRRRRYAAARLAVDAALTIFGRIDARPWVEQAGRTLARLGGGGPEPATPVVAHRFDVVEWRAVERRPADGSTAGPQVATGLAATDGSTAGARMPTGPAAGYSATARPAEATRAGTAATPRRVPAELLPGGALTSTEARIAGLVGQGATNREIAAELFVSVKTVEATLTRVYRKLGVRSRTQLSSRLYGR
ncbi:AAA family ATPase [Micromonospora sp. NPDC050397]|uniref:helix-turn-helix transcriptional regulator n=1 Tax=Micromonospora sp. NPDC050397 TaxID=3364279 RepID=UPI00384BB070